MAAEDQTAQGKDGVGATDRPVMPDRLSRWPTTVLQPASTTPEPSNIPRLRRRQLTEFQTNRGNGRFDFSPSITNNPQNNLDGDAMAAFLLGAPSLIEQDYLLAWVGIRGTEYSAYVADDWRATSKLTLNLGLRYELDTPYNEVANRWANFDPATATVLVAGRNGVSKSAASRLGRTAGCRDSGLPIPFSARPCCAVVLAFFATLRATVATSCGCSGGSF